MVLSYVGDKMYTKAWRFLNTRHNLKSIVNMRLHLILFNITVIDLRK